MTTISNEMSPEALKTIETVQKLLNLANKNPNPEEAASAAAKAQQLLAAHNLEMSAVEEAQGLKEGKRETAKLLGGMYQYQRDLWRAVAELNFCIYWNQSTWEKRKVQRHDPYGQWNEKLQKYTYYVTEEAYARTWVHQIIGRMVNTATTRALGMYLEGAVERLLMERLKEKHDKPNSQRFSSWAVAFREGAIEDITTRLYERRDEVLLEEKARIHREAAERAQRAAERSGASTENAVALADFIQSERDANVDFMMGEEGYSARKRAERAEAARIEAEERARWTEWAKENPEEAAKEQAKQDEENRKYWARRSRSGGSAPERASDKNWGAYKEGKRAGATIGIDTQVSKAEPTRRLK